MSGDDEVLNAREAAKVLNISVWSVYAAANRHELPHRRIGRRLLFSRQALMRWVQGASPRDVGEE